MLIDVSNVLSLYFNVMRSVVLMLSLIMFLVACSGSVGEDWPKLNLLEYDMPISIKAPADPEIKTMDLLVQKDIWIKKGDHYNVQIFQSDASGTDPEKVKNALLIEVKNNPFFSKIVSETSDGFIYETLIDSDSYNYGFRQVKIMGDKEYIFQTGLIGTFSLEDVEKMYLSVQ